MKISHLCYLWLLLSFFTYAQNKNLNQLQETQVWSTHSLSEKMYQEGFAGGFLGKIKDGFIWAGGSFFPEGKPWEGGKKHFSNQIFIFQRKDNTSKFSLVEQSSLLPEAIAEGAFTSINDGLLCIGGQSANGLSNKVYWISWNNGNLIIENYPDLPVAVKGACATTLGNEVYLLGGQLSDGTSINQFLKLDARKGEIEKGWQSLTPYPFNVSAATISYQQDGQKNTIFAFGGRAFNTQTQRTDFFSDVYAYNLTTGHWLPRKEIHTSDTLTSLAMSVAVKVGASHILLVGGDNGRVYNQVEEAIAQGDIQKRDSLWQNHTGFQKQIIGYNTITDQWFDVGQTPNAIAVASGFSDGNQWIIAGGERKPGIRSDAIREYSLSQSTHFGWLNYLVLILYFGGMLLVGFFFMKNNNNTDDYFKASGRIPWWAAGISIFATTLSAITFISIPAKTYATDWRMLTFNMTIILAVPIIIRYFLPFFIRFNFSTAYQYLEERFNRSVRWVASSLFVFFMISRIAIVLFLPSLALNAVTGFSVYYAILIMSIVTIIYSTSGGMEAVIWGDVIQGFILIIGALSAFVFMILGIEGGLQTFWKSTMEYQKIHIFDFNWDWSQPVFWVVLLGGLANTIISYTSDQSVVQRYMTTVDEKATAKSIWLNGIISVPVSILFFLLGTGLFAFYQSNPERMALSNPNIDSVFPQFIVSQMPIGFAGLLIAAIFAAAMSTLSSNINSVSAVITSDFYKTIYKNTSFRSDMLIARISGIVVGLLGTLMAIVLATWDIASLWDQFNTFLGLLTSGLGALFILGIFFPRVGSVSALMGLLSGIVCLYVVKENTNLSFLLYGLIGMISSIVSALMVSFFIPNKKIFKNKLTWKGK